MFVYKLAVYEKNAAFSEQPEINNPLLGKDYHHVF